jgi:CheY-like chemotaxis protein
MKAFIEKLTQLIGDGDLNTALMQMSNLLSIAASDLKNDAVLLRGRLNKLKSDVRRGVVDAKDENIEYNKICVGTLDLLEMLQNDTPQLEGFLADMEDSASRNNKPESELDSVSQLKNAPATAQQKDALFERMAFVKEKKLSLKALWIDDNTLSVSSEQRLIAALGVNFDFVKSSSEAESVLLNKPYDFVISDINRDNNAREGIDFIKKLAVTHQKRIPTIFYIIRKDDKYGVPPYAFGITNSPVELIHLVLDIIERM